MFVATKYFVTTNTNVLSRQAYFYRDKRRVMFVDNCVCRDKYSPDKSFVATKINKHVFVATKMILVTAPANEAMKGLIGRNGPIFRVTPFGPPLTDR